METVTLLPIMHKGAEQILICFSNLKTLNDAVKRLPAARWSQTHKSWFLPLHENNYKLICRALRHLAQINTYELHKYLLKRNIVQAVEVPKALVPAPDAVVKHKSAPVNISPLPAPQPSVAYRLSY